jgi:hypothetical protein
MAKRNGGIIGPSNVPTGQYGGTAKGVWRLRDAFNYIKAGLWPGQPYSVGNSLRFNSGSSDNLTRTFGTATSRRIYTISNWIKRSNLDTVQNVFTAGTGSGDAGIRFNSGNELFFYEISSPYSAYNFEFSTSQLFRDVSAWYHIVVAVDTTQATSTNRVKIYVNGSQVTAFGTANYPSQNYDSYINNSVSHKISGAVDTTFGTRYFNGYTSESYFIDGQQLTPSSFGQTDSATGIWTPLPYTGTYGTNGFYLKFANSSALGTDSSGNGNTFTANNLTSVDQSTDTPTNSFATLNPLSQSSYITLSNGNLDSLGNTGADEGVVGSTLAVDTGKWYVEFKVTGGITSARPNYGIIPNPNANFTNGGAQFGNTGGMRYGPNGIVYTSGVNVGTFATFTTNDIIGIAIDATNGAAYISKNGVFQNSGNPTSGSSKTGAVVTWTGGTVQYFICVDEYNGTTSSTNFGSPNYAANSYADGAGFGNFSYAVPSGYYALCTKNLNTYG